jgi:hypothetical protein
MPVSRAPHLTVLALLGSFSKPEPAERDQQKWNPVLRPIAL